LQLQRAEADTLRKRIKSLIEERSVLEKDMQAAQTSLVTVQEELANANQKRRQYLQSAVKAEIASLVEDLNGSLSYFSEVSERAKEIRDFPIWKKEDEELQNELSKLDDPRDQQDLIARRYERPSTRNRLIFRLMEWERGGPASNERLEQSERIVVECGDKYPSSAISWLLGTVENRSFSLLFPDDAKRLRRKILSVIRERGGNLRYSACVQQAALISGERISADVAHVDGVISSIRPVVDDISGITVASE
jgi:hypothetical protein